MNINKLALQIYEQNKAVGWWDDPDRCVFQSLQLVSTEIVRDRLACALIHLLNMGGRYNWPYTHYVHHHELINIDASVGKQLFACNMALCALGNAIGDNNTDLIHSYYSKMVNSLIEVAVLNGYDIRGVLTEKLGEENCQ